MGGLCQIVLRVKAINSSDLLSNFEAHSQLGPPFLGGAEVQLEIQSGAAASLFVLLSLDSRLDSGVTLKSREREEAKKADLL